MKTLLLKIAILFSLLFLSGACVPYDTKYFDYQIVGKRVDASNQNISEIERRKKETYAIAIFSAEGFFYNATIVSTYNYYLIYQDGTERALTQINKSGTSYAYLYDILPVQDSNVWIAFWLEGDEVEYSYVGLNLIVFDENQILHKNKVKNSIRTSTSRWNYSDSYSIIPINGNREIKFRTKNGEIIYNVMNDQFKTIN